MTEEGCAKYVYSKEQWAGATFGAKRNDSKPLFGPPRRIISPGSTSLTNSASTAVRAQLSDAAMYVPDLSCLPMQRGLYPLGSLIAKTSPRLLRIVNEYAPTTSFERRSKAQNQSCSSF